VSIRKYRYTGSHLAQRMIDRLLNLSHRKSCEILSAGCAFFPDASIDEQLGMIALPVGDRSVGNERAGLRSARAFEPLVGSLMPPAKPDQASGAKAIRAISGVCYFQP
jgi:hypothetical protein